MEYLDGKVAKLACIFLSLNIFICNIESLGCFVMKLDVCTRVKILTQRNSKARNCRFCVYPHE